MSWLFLSGFGQGPSRPFAGRMSDGQTEQTTFLGLGLGLIGSSTTYLGAIAILLYTLYVYTSISYIAESTSVSGPRVSHCHTSDTIEPAVSPQWIDRGMEQLRCLRIKSGLYDCEYSLPLHPLHPGKPPPWHHLIQKQLNIPLPPLRQKPSTSIFHRST